MIFSAICHSREGGLCLKCILKKLKDVKTADHILKRRQGHEHEHK